MSRFATLVCGSIFTVAYGTAAAQYCPAGQHPVVGQGFSYCVPNPGETQSTSPPNPEARWADRYGAVVSDDKAGILGSSTGALTQADAEAIATRDCKSKGGIDCTLSVAYGNKCVALVTGDSLFNVKLGKTPKEAEDAAMTACHDSNCRVFFSDCSLPVRVQ